MIKQVKTETALRHIIAGGKARPKGVPSGWFHKDDFEDFITFLEEWAKPNTKWEIEVEEPHWVDATREDALDALSNGAIVNPYENPAHRGMKFIDEVLMIINTDNNELINKWDLRPYEIARKRWRIWVEK